MKNQSAEIILVIVSTTILIIVLLVTFFTFQEKLKNDKNKKSTKK
ncbi:hypothetical protein RS022_06680 [Candidatus Phytoplasma rubi]|uniref:Uncharacterized protein n=1 Tax=Candidatus Phytoplasma rubi TaxID=399025 RepID=A0ABY7BQG9_9MOLU|nr:hypothetical protein [Candidatus Phytoplasma rubi]WAN63038.1 hypothetical protein RS022_00270 [Candidatus Phytoplasma rubi]WAN63502.1 hypothetical protein RS022_06680 [Candidatus Phytoplasma rubi]